MGEVNIIDEHVVKTFNSLAFKDGNHGYRPLLHKVKKQHVRTDFAQPSLLVQRHTKESVFIFSSLTLGRQK